MSKQILENCVIVQAGVDETLFDSFKADNDQEVVILEGRPKLNAAQDSCDRLLKRNITPTVIADNMAGFLFFKKIVKEVWISYELADKNGALCAIGALILGVLGLRHKININGYPAARKTDFIANPKELFYFNGKLIAHPKIKAYAPLMEWVPAKYITKIYERRTHP